MNPKFVFDTNTLVSAALLGNSISAKALDHALNIGRIVVSDSALAEFAEVIFRTKFDKYFLNADERSEAVDFIAVNSLMYSPKIVITACRDAKDNKFLELAVAAEASCIITGDKDLLVLHPFEGIQILSAAEFLMYF